MLVFLQWVHLSSEEGRNDAIEVMDRTGDHPVSEVSLRKVNHTSLFFVESILNMHTYLHMKCQ